MTNNQNFQTTNSNDNIIELDSEQQLQDITGGCWPCVAVGVSAGVEAGTKVVDGIKTGVNAVLTRSTEAITKEDNLKGTAKVAALSGLVVQSVKNVIAKPTIVPCEKIVPLGAAYGGISKHL